MALDWTDCEPRSKTEQENKKEKESPVKVPRSQWRSLDLDMSGQPVRPIAMQLWGKDAREE